MPGRLFRRRRSRNAPQEGIVRWHRRYPRLPRSRGAGQRKARPGRVTASRVEPFPGDPPVTADLVRQHHLTEEEYDRILAMLGRTPTFAELGIFSALWSEHCSYKHSRPVLKRFPTEGPRVLQGPGENAGVLRLGNGWAVGGRPHSPQGLGGPVAPRS